MSLTSKLALTIVVAAVAITVGLSIKSDDTPTVSNTSSSAKKTSAPTQQFNRKLYSTTDPTSFWVIVNKQHPLQPSTYAPSDLRLPNVSQRLPGATEMQLRDEPADALEVMFAAAEKDGVKLQITTAYRGYAYQKTLYDGYVAKQGQAAADKQSARPGYSEHQTGLAVDIRPQSGECYLEACFGTTPEGIWLAKNAHDYSYIIRYPEGKESVTGYEYEPWHIRYVGKDLSQEMYDKNILTLEEFFTVSGGQQYTGN